MQLLIGHGQVPTIMPEASFSIRFPVHLYYPAAVRTLQRHDDPAGARLPDITGPFLAPSFRAFHFPDNTASSPQNTSIAIPRTDMGTREPDCLPDSPFIVCALLVLFRGAYAGLDALLIQKIPELLIIQISFQITGIILCLHGILQNTDPVRHSKQIIMRLIVKTMLVCSCLYKCRLCARTFPAC